MENLTYRELYAPGHFGNSYEVLADYQMRDVLQEAKSWGFNAYGDWLDCADLRDPFNNPYHEWLLPQALWERKVSFFKIAQEIGLQTNLCVTPNHVYLDQLAPDLLADRSGGRIQGQLICPSKPAGHEIVLKNQRNVFKGLKDRGIRLDAISACPYDYGGCNCPLCRPWILTFGKLAVEIHEIAKEYFPEIKARLIGWWWTAQEHDLFKEWADKEAHGRFISMAAHIPYGETRPAAVKLPERCESHAFVHIGYADKASPRDVYGPWGPVIAPNRLARTVYELKGIECKGYMAYSEGLLDDLNKALLGALSSGKSADSRSVLAEYSDKYFGARGWDRKAWAAWLVKWGEPWGVDVVPARKEFDRLAEDAPPSWRLAQWEAKLRIFEAHAEASKGDQWGKARLAAGDRFFLERDKLYREVWQLGLVRHVLHPRYHPPSWLSDWQKTCLADGAAFRHPHAGRGDDPRAAYRGDPILG